MEGGGQCEWNIEKHNEGMTAATVTGEVRSHDWTELMSDSGFDQLQASYWLISPPVKERRGI